MGKGRYGAVIAFMCCILVDRGTAQLLRTAPMLTAVKTRLTQLQGKYESDGTTRGLASAASVATDRLVQQWRVAGDTELPRDYLLGLQADLRALDFALDAKKLDEVRPAISDARDDLTLKADFASRSADSAAHLGGNATFGLSIAVTVTTVHDGKPVDGLLVRASPRRFADPNHPTYVFNGNTSPVTRPIPPGNYVFFLLDAKGNLVLSIDESIGVGIGQSDTLRITIP